MELLELKKIMQENGIVGCGGAGFPSYAKLDNGIDTIIVNCAECEPLLRLHRQLMERKASEVLKTVDLIRQTIGAKQVIIALKTAYVKAIQALESQIDNYSSISIKKLKEVYPAGDEVVLVYETIGRVVGPGKLPKSVNCVIYNVETIYNVYNALHNIPVTHKYVTVGGEVKNSQTFYVPIGTPFKDLVDMCGGETVEDYVYLVGGPMMGTIEHEFNHVTKTTNAVIILPHDHYVIMRKRANPKLDLRKAMSACCQCSYCTDMCPRHLLGHPIDPANFMRVVSNQDSINVEPYLNSFYCSGCGLCEMYSCGQGLAPRTLLDVFKKSLRKDGLVPPKIENECKPIENRELRRVPLKRLRARLDLEKYNKSAPIVDTKVNPKQVKIRLSGNIDKPGEILVKVGDHVNENDLIIKHANNMLSVNLHASISGIVTEISKRHITIESK